jgi:flagella basal body P-ring formation protein FlgA
MRLSGKTVILAVLLLLALAVSEASGNPGAPALQFKADAAAAGEYITLNNLVELPPEMAQRYGQALIWAAPPPGQIFTLTREFLQYRLTQMGLGEIIKDAHLPVAIQVRQTGVVLNPQEISEVFKRHIQGQSPWQASDLNITVYPLDEPILLPDNKVTLEVLPPKGQERLLGDLTLEMVVLRSGQAVKRFKVHGKVILEQMVVCATRQLNPQTKIAAGDVRLARRDVTNLPQRDIFTAEKQVIGHILAKAAGPQEIITGRHLSNTPIIKRGEEVTVVLDQDGLVITTKGVVREDGFLGRTIRVGNSKSKKEFQAEVMDAKTVKVVL